MKKIRYIMVFFVIANVLICPVSGSIAISDKESGKKQINGAGSGGDPKANTGFEPGYHYIGGMINSANGNLYFSEKDISVSAGGFNIEIIRTYNSHRSGFEGPFGYGWTHNYNIFLNESLDGGYILWVDGDGSIHNFTSLGDGNYSSPEGLYQKLTKNASGFTLWFKTGLKYNFDLNGKLTTIADKNDNHLNFTYTGGKLTCVEDDSGAALTLNYLDNNIISIKDPLNRTINYGYSECGCNLVNVTDAMNYTTKYNYYDNQKLANNIDKSGVTTTFSYYNDTTGSVEEVWNSVFHDSTKSYSNPFRMYRLTYINGTTYLLNARNYAFAIKHNDAGNPVQVIDSLGGRTNMGWANNTLINFTDANGNAYRYEYDDYGNLIKETDPLGYETLYGWDNRDDNKTHISLFSNITKIAYEKGGKVVVFNDTMESGVNGWNASANWIRWTGEFHSNNASWGCGGPLGLYGEGWDETLDSPDIDLSGYVGAELSFWHKGDFEDNWTLFDGGNVKVSTDGGKTWNLITPYDGYDGKLTFGRGNPLEVERAFGYSFNWTREKFDLSAYTGMASDVKIRFEFGSDNFSSGDAGWNIDDVVVTAYTDVPKHITTHVYYDNKGNLIEIKDATGNNSYYVYDEQGNLINATDFRGYTTLFNYDLHSNMINITDATGNITRFSYDAAGRLINLTDANGHTTTSTYDDNGRIIKVTDAAGNETTYNYSVNGALISTTDSNGYQTNYTSNVVGGVEKVTDATGNTTYYKYNRNGDVVESTNTEGNTTNTDYDPLDRPTSVTDALGNAEWYGYDSVGNVIWVMDKNYGVTNYEYDKLNRLTRVVDPLNGEVVYKYDEFGNIIKITDENGNSESYEYDDLNRRIRVAGLSGCGCDEKRYAYDANSNMIRVTNANNHTTSYEYNPLNLMTKIIDPSGNYTQYGYDAVGNLKTITDKNGHTTGYDYDPLNRVKKITDATGNSTQFSYDAVGNLKTITNARGYTTEYYYDELYRLIKITDATGNSTLYGYDSVGNLKSITDENGNVVTYTYDALGQVTRITDALGHEIKYNYDPEGNIINIIDANGKTTQFWYDPLNRMTARLDASGNYAWFGYDKKGNMVSVTDANGGTTQYTYDKLDRLTSVTPPMGSLMGFSTQYVYDPSGNVIQRIDANGNIINYTYDKLNRLTLIDYPSGNVSYAYDAEGNDIQAANNGIGLNDMTYYVYNELNRPISVKVNYGLFNKTINYTYDEIGNTKTMTDPNGGVTTYDYDPVNRLIKITDPDNDITTYDYDNSGRKIMMNYPNGAYTAYSYDAANNLLNITNKKPDGIVISGYAYTYDKTGNRLSMTDHNGNVTAYNYDHVYRLINVTYPSGAVTQYVYDGAGNRLSQTINLTIPTGYVYDSDNRLIFDGAYNYFYDNNGNLINKTGGLSTTTYNYDYEDRLIQVTLPDMTIISYQYSPFWDRISKSNGTATTYYFHDMEDILMEFNNSGSVIARYTHGPGIDDSISINRSGVKGYYHFDGLGSVTSLTNSTGNVINTYVYNVFGNIINENEVIENPYRYTSRVHDKETGIYYYRFRYYGPEIGRFLTKDPLEMIDGPNLYTYVNNNPVNFVDPWGEQTDMSRLKTDPEYKKCIDVAWAKYHAKLNKIPHPSDDPECEKLRDEIKKLEELIKDLKELSEVLSEANRNAVIKFISQYVITAVATVVTAPMGGWGGILVGAAISGGGSAAVTAATGGSAAETIISGVGGAAGSFTGGALNAAGSTGGRILAETAIGTATSVASNAVSQQPQVTLADVIAEYGDTNTCWINSLIKNNMFGTLRNYVNKAIGNLEKAKKAKEKELQKCTAAAESQTRPAHEWATKERIDDIKKCNDRCVITPSGGGSTPTPPNAGPEGKVPSGPTPITPRGGSGSGSDQGSIKINDSVFVEPGSGGGIGVTGPLPPDPDPKPICNVSDPTSPPYNKTTGDGGGHPPGTGNDPSPLSPPSFCEYRISYFGSLAVSDIGENHKALYNAIKWVARHSNCEFTTILVMPGWGGYTGWNDWQNFAAKYPDIILKRWSSNSTTRTTVTYSGLKAAGADVLIDSDHYSSTEQGGYYTEDEINAIQKYLEDEHGYIATHGTLGDNSGQENQTDVLLALLGLNESGGAPHKSYTNSNPWIIDNPGHPIMRNVSSGWNPGDVTGNVDIGVCPLCGEKHEAAKIAHLSSSSGDRHTVISAYDLWFSPFNPEGNLYGEGGVCVVAYHAIYFGNRVIEDYGENRKALYNAIKWAAKHDDTDQTKILIMPGWGGYDGWSEWQEFAGNHSDIVLARWSDVNDTRVRVTRAGLEAMGADVLIDSDHYSAIHQGGYYSESELLAIEWYVKTKGHGYIATSGTLGNETGQENQTGKLMELMGLKEYGGKPGKYENNNTWIPDSPYHPVFQNISAGWNPGNVTGNVDVNTSSRIAHLYSSSGSSHSLISAYEGYYGLPAGYGVSNVPENLSIKLLEGNETKPIRYELGLNNVRVEKLDGTPIADIPVEFCDSDPDFGGITGDSGITDGRGYAFIHVPNESMIHKTGSKTLYVPVVSNSSRVCADNDSMNKSDIEYQLNNSCSGGEWIYNPPVVVINSKNYYKITGSETHEVNGTGGGEASEPDLPDLTVTNIVYNPKKPVNGSILFINASIKNSGNINLNLDSVNVSINISNSDFIDWQLVNLTNKTEINVTFNRTAVPGEHTLTVKADPCNAVNETNETNNELNMNLFVYHKCDLNYDGIITHDYNDLMLGYKCFLGIKKNCDKISYRDWTGMKEEYECFNF